MSVTVDSNATLSSLEGSKKSSLVKHPMGEKALKGEFFKHLVEVSDRKSLKKDQTFEGDDNQKPLAPDSSAKVERGPETEEFLKGSDQTGEDELKDRNEQPIIFIPLPLNDQKVSTDIQVETLKSVDATYVNSGKDTAKEAYIDYSGPLLNLVESENTSPLNNFLATSDQQPLPHPVPTVNGKEAIVTELVDIPILHSAKDFQVDSETAPYISRKMENPVPVSFDTATLPDSGASINSLPAISSADLLSDIQQDQEISELLTPQSTEKVAGGYIAPKLDDNSSIKANYNLEKTATDIITSLRNSGLHPAEDNRLVTTPDATTNAIDLNILDISSKIEQSLLAQASLASSGGEDKELLPESIENLEQRVLVVQGDNKLLISFKKEVISNTSENIPHRAEQITMAVRIATQHGKNQISLNMYPENLGSVDISVEFDKVGVVHSIKVFAEKPETLRLLIRDYAILERSLNEVVKTDEATLSFNLKSGQNGNSNYQHSSGQHSNSSGILATDDEREINRYQVTVKPTTNAKHTDNMVGVDIRI